MPASKSSPVTRPLANRVFHTTVELHRATAKMFPDLQAYVDGEDRITFSEWDRKADLAADVFAECGLGRGDVLCLMIPGSIDYAVCYLGAMRLGAITSGINLRLGPLEIASIVERTAPSITICEDGEVPGVPGASMTRAELAGRVNEAEAREFPPVRADDAVAVVWTSGTTGIPKGAVFDHQRLHAVADSTGRGLTSAPFDRRMSPVPFAHMGYMTRVWDELSNAVTNVMTPKRWSAGWAISAIERERITVGQGTPTQWRLIMDHPTFASTDLSSLRAVTIGAATVPPDIVREIRQRIGCPVVQRYTSTETAIATTTTLEDRPEVVANTVGVPCPGVELRILVDGRAAAAEEVGGVQIRSQATMREYWRDPELTASVLDGDGWLDTGDLGWLGHDGYLRVVGRRKEMYIRGGYNVYPAEVEAILNEHPKIVQSAVVGTADPILGQIGVAFAVPVSGASLSLDDVREWITRYIADYKRPDHLEVVTELPITPMNKIDKRALGARAADLFPPVRR